MTRSTELPDGTRPLRFRLTSSAHFRTNASLASCGSARTIRAADFTALATGVRKEYMELGFAFERAAVAHITIARNAAGALPPLAFTPIRLHALELTLFESLQASRTTRYEALTRAKLRG